MAADIVITEFMDAAAVDDLGRDFRVHYDPDLAERPDAIAALAADARALIVRNRTQVRGALLDACPRLVAVGRLGVGLDNIDTAACAARGVKVFPATGANTVAVAELVIGGLLLLRRGAFLYSAAVAAGDWPRQTLSAGRELNGATLGLVGFGAIAQAVALRARALQARLLCYDPLLADGDLAGWPDVNRCATLAELLAASDAVSLHVPLTGQTRGLLDAAALATLPDGAIVVNTARGGVVDERALAAEIAGGRLSALLDVFADEPLAAGSPLADALRAAPQRLILTPHIGGVSAEANVRVSALTAAKVRAALAV